MYVLCTVSPTISIGVAPGGMGSEIVIDLLTVHTVLFKYYHSRIKCPVFEPKTELKRVCGMLKT
jgi:hypothetical protein